MDELLGSPGAGSYGPGEGLDLKRYANVLRRRRWVITAVSALSFAAVAAYVSLQDDVFTAETVLLIERQPHNVIDVRDLVAEDARASDFYNTQFEILRSRTLIAQVIRELSLNMSIRAYGSRLNVRPIRSSRLVKLTFTHTDPQLASRIINRHAREFIQRGLERHTRASDSARSFLDSTLADLTRRLSESEDVLGAFRRETGIVSSDDSNQVALGRVVLREQQLAEAEGERIALETQFRTLREHGAAALPAVADNARVITLRDELARLELENKKQLIPNPSLEIQIDEARRLLEAEIERFGLQIENAYRAARALETRLARDLEQEKESVLALKDTSAEYAMLEYEVESNRQLYDSVLQRKKELGMAAALRMSNVFVIDEAFPPTDPSGRSAARTMLFGLFGSIGLGVGCGIGLELLDNTVKTRGDIERFLGLPHLGTIPKFPEARRSRRAASESTDASDASASALQLRSTDELKTQLKLDLTHVVEAHRAIRTNILLSQAGEPPRTLLFTSATPGEGKTITCLGAAVSLAHAAGPVLVIDGDLRRPRCHKLLGVDRQLGLTEVLAGHREAGDAIEWITPEFAFLGGGAHEPPDPAELLGSERMHSVLDSVREEFAFVVIDAPPLLPVSDALALSPHVDGVLLVIGYGVPKQTVARAFGKLEFARARTIGAIMNGFDPRDSGDVYGYAV
jgi:capsular exopolysaccharide synthesis family protein